jgi:hypothetical protein
MTPLKSLKKLRSVSANFLEGGGNFLYSVDSLLRDIQKTLAQLEQREQEVAAREQALAEHEQHVQQLIESLKLRAEADMTSLAQSLIANYQLSHSANTSPTIASSDSESIDDECPPLESQLQSDVETLQSELAEVQSQPTEVESSSEDDEALDDDANLPAAPTPNPQSVLNAVCSKPLPSMLHPSRPRRKKRRRQ